MKRSVAWVLGALVIVQPRLLHALDCAKAVVPVDKQLCAKGILRKADEAMSAAYVKLLRHPMSREFREALILSQRRWLKERSRGGFGVDEAHPEGDPKALLKMTRDRFDFLQGTKPIRTMEKQQKIESKVSGGRFAGYDTSCAFLPPPYGDWLYMCLGTEHRQHQGRICSLRTEWASGRFTEYRIVSAATDGEPKPVAGCAASYPGTGEQCPESDDDPETKAIAHWNTSPQPANSYSVPRAGALWKYDPDIQVSDADQPWMRDCLSASTYPEVSRPGPSPGK